VFEYCEKEGIRILMEIPYERRIAELYSKGVPFSLEMPEWVDKFQVLYSNIKGLATR